MAIIWSTRLTNQNRPIEKFSTSVFLIQFRWNLVWGQIFGRNQHILSFKRIQVSDLLAGPAKMGPSALYNFFYQVRYRNMAKEDRIEINDYSVDSAIVPQSPGLPLPPFSHLHTSTPTLNTNPWNISLFFLYADWPSLQFWLRTCSRDTERWRWQHEVEHSSWKIDWN